MQLNGEAEALTLERILAILRRRWWVIALATVLVGAATFVFSERQTKQYTATASVLFLDQSASRAGGGPAGLRPDEPGSGADGDERQAADSTAGRGGCDRSYRRPRPYCRRRRSSGERLPTGDNRHSQRLGDEPKSVAGRHDREHLCDAVHRQPAQCRTKPA